MTFIYCIFFSLFAVFPISPLFAATEHYEYIEKTGAAEEVFVWELFLEDGAKVVSTNESEQYINVCNLKGETSEWHLLKKDGSEITAKRTGTAIHLKGQVDGSVLDKLVEIGDGPWFQPLSFSLRNFVESSEEEIEFWTIRSDIFKPVKMTAVKKEIETVAVNGQGELAQKIEIRLSGFLSVCWHCNYWFRLGDGLFLQYEGVHGPPGTPATVIRLHDEKGS